MTGLDEKVDHILEIAAVVTDLDFKPLAELHHIVFQPPAVLDGMNEWCKKTHGASGLTAAVPTGTPLMEVEAALVALTGKHFPKNERVIIAGNSIGNDRRFIDAYMPAFASKLHYRMVDVSSFKEIFRDRYGFNVKKGETHRALEDVHASIAELQAYLSLVVSDQPNSP